MTVRLVLASASPARLQTLRRAGLDPSVVVSGVDESVATESGAADLALRLARLKGEAVVRTRPDPLEGQRELVVACDSVLELDGSAYGKPGSRTEAVERLTAMSGHSGVLHTGHYLADVGSGRALARGAATVVHFAELTSGEIDAYVATGEPLTVAGAFTLDGLGGAFVRGIEGDPHNVVGISLPLLRLMAVELGVAWTDLWPPTR
ncbi:MAG: septum formation inhibitor Maf [Nocardioidaceae bacterium]|nr:septum formation inhibitor Maf [Nocardioidaceae bacterium]